MKTNTSKFIQVAVLTLGFLASASMAHAAGTWTAAPATPPGSNVDTPINVGTASQQKNGVLGTTGFANFGRAELLGYTHVGAYPCGSGCASGAPATDPGTTTTGGSVGGLGYLGGATHGNMLLGNVFASLGSSFANLFTPNKAYALDLSGAGGTVVSGGGGGTGGTTATGGTIITEPSVTFTPTATSIGTGTTDSISYTVANSSGCTVTSSNPGNNWNGTITTTSGSATGTRSLGTFASQGTYTYNVSCAPSSGSVAATATANITVGPTYIFQVDGNTRLNGYLDTTGGIVSNGTIKQGGVPVCLQNGTNCNSSSVTGTGTVNFVPKYTSTSGDIADSRISDDGSTVKIGALYLKSDQSGSIELGGEAGVANTGGNQPYLDFHYGTGSAQDYNVRMINSGDSRMDFQTAGQGTVMSFLNTSQSVSVKNAVPIYKGCGASDHLLYRDNGSGGGCNLFGYLLPPPPAVSVPTVRTGNLSDFSCPSYNHGKISGNSFVDSDGGATITSSYIEQRSADGTSGVPVQSNATSAITAGTAYGYASNIPNFSSPKYRYCATNSAGTSCGAWVNAMDYRTSTGAGGFICP